MRYLFCFIVVSALVSPIFPSLADDRPSLDQTKLYRTITHDCRAQDIATWHHPVKNILEQKKVGLSKVELCNDGKYPIFTVALPYDPQAQTGSYFHKLYAEVMAANGGWPYAFVDTSDDEIVTVSGTKQNIAVDYEAFR